MTSKIDISEAIIQIELSDGHRIILQDRLAKGEQFSKEEQSRNIFRLDSKNEIQWQVWSHFDTDGYPFTNIRMDSDKLLAYRWDGGTYEVDKATGLAVPLILER